MKSYFYHPRSERQGILILLSFLILSLVLPALYGQYLAKPKKLTWSYLAVDTLEAIKEQIDTSIQILEAFNPNTISKEKLISYGLSSKTANTLIRFREKGGRFYKKRDLLKIYGMDTLWYHKVEAHLLIPREKNIAYTKTKVTPKRSSEHPKKKASIIIPINEANAEEWMKLRGIGPVLSSRIVKFRAKLGGFYSIEQVGQTYGLPDSTFQKIRPQLRLEGSLEKIAINTLTIEALAQHPYISWKSAKMIVNYRKMHGKFEEGFDFKQIKELEYKKFKAVLPYIVF